MFAWLLPRSKPLRVAGHTAPEWYFLYRKQKLPLDPACDVAAALCEALTGSNFPSGCDLDSDSCLSALLMTDQREEVRSLAAIKIGINKMKTCESGLIAALEDQSETVRRIAALALVDIDTIRGLAAVVAGNNHGHAVRTQAANRLQKRGFEAAEAIPGLLALLRFRQINWRSHLAAVDALAAIGEPAIPFLVHALTNGEPQLRRYAGAVLKFIGKSMEFSELIEKELEWPEDESRSCF